jgi:hypothetical protein
MQHWKRILYCKTKKKVCITAGAEFGTNLSAKSQIINIPLDGSKTSTVRFHEHLAVSLLLIEFKKAKN